MNPEIASLHARMAQGGDWKAFQQEIARLNKEARSQDEYVTVLEAHRHLMLAAKQCFSAESLPEIQGVGAAEYKLFLNIEAMEGDMINPVMLDRITAREVAAGRLGADDEFRKLAQAGALLGDSADSRYDRKLGDGLAIAGALMGLLTFFMVGVTPGVIVFFAGVAVGWFVNESRKRRALHGASIERAARGYRNEPVSGRNSP